MSICTIVLAAMHPYDPVNSPNVRVTACIDGANTENACIVMMETSE